MKQHGGVSFAGRATAWAQQHVCASVAVRYLLPHRQRMESCSCQHISSTACRTTRVPSFRMTMSRALYVLPLHHAQHMSGWGQHRLVPVLTPAVARHCSSSPCVLTSSTLRMPVCAVPMLPVHLNVLAVHRALPVLCRSAAGRKAGADPSFTPGLTPAQSQRILHKRNSAAASKIRKRLKSLVGLGVGGTGRGGP